jgi:uncharacterized protein with HEPN domain
MAERMRRDAIAHNFLVIGEAIKHIPEEEREKYPGIEWKRIAGLRDIVAHAYFGLDWQRLWNTIHDYLPKLKDTVRQILDDEVSKDMGAG